jgi:hypothetical protein
MSKKTKIMVNHYLIFNAVSYEKVDPDMCGAACF